MRAILMVFALVLSAAGLTGCKKESDWVDPPPVPVTLGRDSYFKYCVEEGDQRLLFVASTTTGTMTQVMGADGRPMTC